MKNFTIRFLLVMKGIVRVDAIFNPAAIIAYPRDILSADDADRQRSQSLATHPTRAPVVQQQYFQADFISIIRGMHILERGR